MKDLLQCKKYGNTPFKSRVLSLLLSFALFLSMCPQVVLFTAEAVVKSPISVEEEMLQAVQEERIAIFDNWSEFLLSKDPKTDEGEYLEYDAIGAKGLVVKILDTYYDKETGSYWYQIGPHSTNVLPAGMGEYTWVLYTTDFDLEYNYQPYLALYSADQTIRFVDVQYTLDGETVESYIVVAGPAALKRTIITTAEVTTPYETSAMSYYYEDVDENGELVVEAWHRSFHIEVLKDTGPWQPEDGELSIRFMANQALNSSNSYYMGAFLYAGDKLQDFAAVDYWASASGVVYTGEGIVDLNLEMMCESFEVMGYQAYFGYSDVFLHDVYFTNDTKQMSLQEKGAYVDIEYFFVDEDGFGWYFMTNSAINEQKYFLVECGLVDFLYEGEPLDYNTARLFLMRATTLEVFENVYECLTEELIAEFVEQGTWEAIQSNYDHLVYCDFFGKESVSDFMALKEAYPSAWEYIQADPDLKACVDLHLENLQYAEAHPVEPDIILGEGVLADSDTVFNPGGIVFPADSELSGPVNAPSVASTRVGYVNHARGAFENRAVQQAAILAEMNQNRASGSTDSVVLSKTVSPVAGKAGEYIITLEAYTTGETITIVTEKQVATDIVLILDMSSSLNTQFPVSEYRQVVRATAEDLFLSHENDLLVKVGDSYQKVSITTGGTTKPAEGYKQALGDRPTARNLYDAIKTSGEIIYYRTGNNNNYKYYALSAYARGSADVDSTSGSGTVTYYFYYTDENGTVRSVNNGVGANTTLTGTNFWKGKPITYTQYTFTLNGVDMDGDGKNDTIVYADTDSVTDKYLVDAEGNPLKYYVQIEDNRATRLDAMIAAVEEFVYSVEQQSKGKDGVLGTEDDVAHRIAVVGFNNYSSDNTGIYIGDTVYKYSDNSYKAQCGNAFQNMSTSAGVANVYKSIGKINTASSTHAHCALEMAYDILKANPGGITEGETRNKTVVFFTDGDPNIQNGSDSTHKGDNAYNLPIEHAYNIKNDEDIKATIFAVAIWYVGNNTLNETTGKVPNGYSNTNQKVDRYLHYISSNFQQAKKYTDDIVATNTNYPDTNYYLLAKDANELSDIFVTIKNTVVSGGTTATLSTETQIKDMISPYFELPPDASVSDIKIFTADYMGVSNGEEQWAGEQPFPGAIVELSADRKTVSVSGFDYKANWVGTAKNGNTTENHGKKLIIKIPIKVLDTFLGGDNVPTNTNESGIYNGDSPVEKFIVPQTDILIAELNYKNFETNIYYGNSISLQDVLDQLVKAMGNIPLQGVADGGNNGFVDMQFALTTNINGQEKKYVYTLEAGQDWSEGTWDSENEDMSNVVLTQDTVYTVHVVLEHDSDYNTLQVSLDAAQHLVQNHYTKTTWDALLAQIAESSTKVNDHLQMERAHGNIHLFAAIDALQLSNPTGDDTADELQKLIYLAEATLELYSLDKYKDQGKTILPYQDVITSRLAAANTALNNFKNSKTAENKLAMEANMASLREAVYSLIKFNSVEGTSTFYVYKPELTFKDSVWEYFNALFFYVNESFAQVRAALSGAINALDLGTEAISQALKNLVPVSNYGNETIRAFYNNLLIIRSLDATKYTPESYNTVNGIITELAEGGTDAKWKVDVVSARDALRNAVGALVLEEANQDSEELHRLKLWIFLAKRLEYSCYTTESYTALLTNLTAAEAVLADSEATNAERAEAANALNAAVNALVLARSSGETAIDDLQKIVLLAEGLKSEDFSVGYAELDKKLVEMRESLEEITASMQRGIDGLALRTDYGHASVNKLMVMRSVFSNVDKTKYTSTSYENLRQAVETATSDAGGNLSGKGAAIKTAIEALELVRTDKVHIPLQKAILRAKSLNPAHYEDFTGVQSALEAAEAALTNFKQDQRYPNNQVAAQAATALENALNALRLENATDIQAIDELLPHLLQAEALRTMYIESSGESGYPDLQAFLESHWVGTRWLHVTMDSNGELVTTESTQVLMSGVAPKLELIFDYKAPKDPFDGGRMVLNADLTVGVTVKLIGKRTDGTIGEILLTRTDADRIRFVHSDCTEGKLCLFNANTEEFVIHVHNIALVIEVQGAPENSTDTFLFEIQYKDKIGANQVLYVTVQGNGYAVIAGDLSEDVEYTIKLLTDWSWQYRCDAVTIPVESLATGIKQSADQITVELEDTERNSDRTNHVIFHVTMEGTNWLEDESREDNNFGVFYPDKA